MTATIVLSGNQRENVSVDADGKDMLSPAELEAIATKLNEHVDIPFLSEEREQVVLVKIVKQIDRFLYAVLPNEIYELVKIAHDGISDAEADLMEERLVLIINDYVDLPFLSEHLEEKVFRVVLSIIVGALKKGKSLADLLAGATMER